MTSEVELVIAVWDAVRDHVPHSKRPDTARNLLYAFVEYGFEPAELASIVDEDPDLSEAYDEVFTINLDNGYDEVEEE